MMDAFKTFDRSALKSAGIYVIVILALVRFVLYPLQGAVAEKKTLHAELRETYELKKRHAERQGLLQASPAPRGAVAQTDAEKQSHKARLYAREMIFTSIQADVVDNIMKTAEKKGLTVRNFELLEAVTGKTISEAPVIVRISGPPGDLIEMLRSIDAGARALAVKNMELNRSGPDIMLSLTVSAFRMEK